MGLVPMTELVKEAKQKHYAIAQFNINGYQWAQAIIEAAQEENAPVILAASDRVIDYLGGFKMVVTLVRGLVQTLNVTNPVVLHLDHGQSVARCFAAIDAGFSSVMFDGSKYPIEKNIKLTKQVVDYAHLKGVSVEAEVGSVGGVEDGITGGIQYARLTDCCRMVEETQIDALAAALGSVHGAYHGEPVLGFTEMLEISQATNIPLVLHGASGIPKEQIKKAIELGHAKININTELNQVWAQAVKASFMKNPESYNPQAILLPVKEALGKVVKEKIREFKNNRVF
ncbi:class II fructose-1,6-bisphosphate aldolase [Carnobacterium maltaromaticum]|jgi:6-phospho-5-dehydro-2-deoxy-D-gluconate aldolase|uniref:class II fructose-1,6-bisphosphate aldolase n=1 Tax=Carnobacterium maltaromaticum TaxID=2751 RepID=UPI000E766FBB|nr:class II fructose-1,6-bisphosphate aldolase [Carnobacterium maltaromaticum]AOA02479.1 fructose-1,6-bisphosphate aldolase, class II [Carnobacterium maltaromaticum]MCI1818516.1 class II fructose-1,6-bisphosphate aldolase [Carnobacterium maltaromaticum]